MIRNGSDFVLTLTKSLFALMIGFLLTVLFGLVMIPILKKIKISQRINIYVEAHARKAGTPTMGGLIFIIPTLVTTIILLLLNKIDFSVNLFILLFVFSIFTTYFQYFFFYSQTHLFFTRKNITIFYSVFYFCLS